MEILWFGVKEKVWNEVKRGREGKERMVSLPCGLADFEKANRIYPFGIPASLLMCCVTLEKIFNLSELQSFNYKIGIIMPTSEA